MRTRRPPHSDLIHRASKAWNRRCSTMGWPAQQPDPIRSEVLTLRGQRPLIVLRNARGELARYRYYPHTNRVSQRVNE